MTEKNNELAGADGPKQSNGKDVFSGWRLLLMVMCAGFLAKKGYGTFVKLRETSERAEVISCRNCLENLGLASRIYATDHQGRYPRSWLELTNQLGPGRVLFCSRDAGRYVPGQSIGDSISKATYTYLGAGAMEGDSGRVVTFCPHHGQILMTDGQVVEARKPLTEADFERRDGKLFVRESLMGVRSF